MYEFTDKEPRCWIWYAEAFAPARNRVVDMKQAAWDLAFADKLVDALPPCVWRWVVRDGRLALKVHGPRSAMRRVLRVAAELGE